MIKELHSENKGAGVMVPFEPPSDMKIMVSVKAHYLSEDTLGRYALIVGQEGVAAPSQPAVVNVPNVSVEAVLNK